MNHVSATSPRRATVPAASAQEDSAVLRKKAATCSRVASNAGSPKEDTAMIGAKIRTMPASPAPPVARAKVAHGSGCDMGSVWPGHVTRASKRLICRGTGRRSRVPELDILTTGSITVGVAIECLERYRSRSLGCVRVKLRFDGRTVDQRPDRCDAAVAEVIEDMLREAKPFAARGKAEKFVLWRAVEDEPACHPIGAGNDDLCVEEEVGDRSDVGGDQVLVLTARHRRAVIRQFVLHVVHKIIDASFVQSVKVCPVASLKIGVRHASTSR